MIAKIGKGSNLYGAITYNFQKVASENGLILTLNNMPESLNDQYSVSYLMKCFDPYLSANNKTEKPVRHISLNPDPKDQLTDEDLTAIAIEYMKQLGFEKQPYVVFKHTDIERTHMHIVSTCVGSDGKKIPDYKDHVKSMAICRNIEKRYGLLPAVEKSNNQPELNFNPVSYLNGNIKSQISSVVRYLPQYYKFQTLSAYNALLSLFNITVEEVKGEIHGQQKNGLVYFAIDDSGNKVSNPFKSSLFGKQAGINFLYNHFEKSKFQMKSGTIKSTLKNTLESILMITKSEQEYRKELMQHGINIVVRRNEGGRIYGITFIDHDSHSVWNGSQLSKGLSANFLNDYWNCENSNKIIDSVQEENLTFNSIETEPHSLFNFIEGMGSILPGVQGDDFEEVAFEHRMKRRKKLKRKN